MFYYVFFVWNRDGKALDVQFAGEFNRIGSLFCPERNVNGVYVFPGEAFIMKLGA